MKKVLVGSFILFLSANAFAGESSQYAGPYAGLYLGYSQGDSKGYETGAGIVDAIDHASLARYMFGGLVGYNKSFSNDFIFGLEADFESRDSKKNANLTDLVGVLNGDSVETKIQNAYSARVRLGRLFNNDKTMVFLTGGYAVVDLKKTYLLGGAALSQSKRLNGYTVGLGAEHFINDAISLKTEYRYSDYGKLDADVGALMNGFVEHSKYENEHSIRFGVMYHF